MRLDGVGKENGDWAERIIARGKAYLEKIARGEIEDPTKYDENGNIIPTPSEREPDIFDGLNLSKYEMDLGGD